MCKCIDLFFRMVLLSYNIRFILYVYMMDTKDFYDIYGYQFDITRKNIWPHVESFLNQIPQWSLVLDVGCGNGKNLKNIKNAIACDVSTTMCNISRTKDINVLQCDCSRLPFRDSSYDIVISVACIHHLITNDERQKAIDEMYRVLKPRGKLLISVWKNNDKYVGDSEVPWRNRVMRFYHMYSIDEVKSHCSAYDDHEIFEDIQNIYFIINKIPK